MASFRYRYKGRFISAEKAQRLSALPSTKKHVSITYPQIKTRKRKESIESLTRKAMDADRKRLRERLDRGKASKASEKIAEKREYRKKREKAKADVIAREISKRARDTGESIDDILDEYYQSGEIGDWDSDYGGDYIASEVSDIFDLDIDYLDFEMADLEDDEKYEQAS